jgi:O-antigen/teichoic acid export membrane protein
MSQLARNTFLLTAASIGQKAIAFIYFAVIARTIGADATGSYFLALALTTTLGAIDDVGLTSVLVREVAKEPKHALEYARNVIGNKLLLIPVTVLLAFLAPRVLGFSAEATMLTQIAVFVMLLDTVSLSMYGVLRGQQNLKFESIGIFIGQSLTTLFGGVALYLGTHDLRWLIVALIVGSGWNAAFAAWNVVRRLGVQALMPSFSLGWKPLKMASMFFVAAVFVKIYSYVDSFTLNMVLGAGAVGVYAVAYKLTYSFQFLPLAFIGALYPTMSAQANSPEKLKQTLLSAEWYLALLAAPVVFGLFALSPEIIHFFYGVKFADAAPTLQILVFALLFIFFDFPIGSLLNATGRQATKTAIMGVTMIINIAANLILIPMLGIPGAGVSALLCFSFMFFAGFYFVRQSVDVTVYDIVSYTGGSLAAGGVMAAVVMVAKEFMPWFATIPLGGAVFFAVAFATKSLTIDHLKSLARLLPGMKSANMKEEISEV